MQEVFFRKGRVTFTAISIFLLSLGYLLMIPLLLEKQPRHVDGLLYFVLAVVYFGALVLLLLNWIYLRLFWKCVIRHQPALVLADDGLYAYQSFGGDYCVLSWQQIEALSPIPTRAIPPITSSWKVTRPIVSKYLALGGVLHCGWMVLSSLVPSSISTSVRWMPIKTCCSMN